MKLVYLNSHGYPSKKVEPFFIQSLGKAFSDILGDDFLFTTRGVSVPETLRNMNTLAISAPKRLRAVYYFLYLPYLIVRKKWSRTDMVLFSSDPYLLVAVLFWKKVCRLKYKVCADWHQLFEDWRDVYIAQNSDYSISTSKKLKSLIVSECGVKNPDKILVAYGGVDPVMFEVGSGEGRDDVRRSLNLPLNKFLVGYVGGFRAIGMEKGIDTMIKSLPLLSDSIMMVFVGGSQEDIDIYTIQAKELGVEEKCIFVRKQLFKDVIRYEKAMDVLTIPYPNKKHFVNYGFPLKVWEYMASGNPIVYSNLEIMKEALAGKAFSFHADDVRDLADTIIYVKNNLSEAKVASDKNKSEIDEYSWSTRAKKILNFIK